MFRSRICFYLIKNEYLISILSYKFSKFYKFKNMLKIVQKYLIIFKIRDSI